MRWLKNLRAPRNNSKPCFLFIRADETRYSELLGDLRKGVLKRKDEYQKMVIEAYELRIQMSGRIGHVQSRGIYTNVRYR